MSHYICPGDQQVCFTGALSATPYKLCFQLIPNNSILDAQQRLPQLSECSVFSLSFISGNTHIKITPRPIAPNFVVFFQVRRFHCLGRAFSKDIFIYMGIMLLSSIRHPSGWAVMKVLITRLSRHPLQNAKFRNSVEEDFTSDFTASKCYWFYLKKSIECFECFNNFTFLFLHLFSKAGNFGHFRWVFS